MKAQATGGVCEAVLMPHAPVLVPEVGGGREREAGATVDALWECARNVVQSRPDALLLISPHSPRRRGRFGLWTGPAIGGDLGRFGRADVELKLPNASTLTETLDQELRERGIDTWPVSRQPLDHGALVPLYFLTRSGWAGPTAVLSLNYPGEGGWQEVGQAIRQTAGRLGTRLAVVASGDMSHRLMPGAPAGYEPRARRFDREFVEVLRSGRYERLGGIDPGLQELAAEDVVDSTLIAAHAVGLNSTGHEVFSYEGPFGVGYCVAELFRAPRGDHPGRILPTIAREALERHFGNGRARTDVPGHEYLLQPAGVFVTLRTRDGRLRGCRGTIAPRAGNVVEETRSVALSSALQDQRFTPVTDDELSGLIYEVSVLHPPEVVASPAELDPRRYGVMVTTDDGRRGLMLPGVEGLDTVEQQIQATCRKARIDPREPFTLMRFTTDHFSES
jgi:AmmeMemoRadiSam system protein A